MTNIPRIISFICLLGVLLGSWTLGAPGQLIYAADDNTPLSRFKQRPRRLAACQPVTAGRPSAGGPGSSRMIGRGAALEWRVLTSCLIVGCKLGKAHKHPGVSLRFFFHFFVFEKSFLMCFLKTSSMAVFKIRPVHILIILYNVLTILRK